MRAALNVLRSLKLWQIAVLAVVIVAGAGASYGAYAMVNGSSSGGLGEDQQVVPVQRGDLVNQVSINGSVTFRNKETLSFGTNGTVAEVLVQPGQQVQEGQVLARLDPATLSTLEKVVAQARMDLQNAEKALEEARNPYTALQIAQAEADVTKATKALRDAQDALAALQNGPDQEAMEKAQAQVNSATIALDNARRNLSLTQKDWDAKLQTERDTFNTAQEAYLGAFSKWLGIDLSPDQVDQDPDTLLTSLGVDLPSLFVRPERPSRDTPSDDPSTPWDETVIFTWVNFYPVPLTPTCDDGQIPNGGTCIKKEMEDAWEAYQKAKDSLETLETQADTALASAQNSVAQAEQNLTSAQQALADILNGVDPLELSLKQQEVAVAQANLEAAQKKLADLQAGADPLAVALRQAELNLARLALDEALQRLEGASLKAPFSGIVTQVEVEVGQKVAANDAVVEIVDPSVVEVDGTVDEIDVLSIREGAQAVVTMDALPGRPLTGTVVSIASAGQSQQGVVTYPVRIRVQVPEGVQLREGLSAVASIVLQQERNVLLVPVQAIRGTFGQPMVLVYNNGKMEERPVTLGNSDDFWVAVREGLTEGEQVVTPKPSGSGGSTFPGGIRIDIANPPGGGQRFIVPGGGRGGSGTFPIR